jgi:uncharacterized protein YbjT (DUF2867 family)
MQNVLPQLSAVVERGVLEVPYSVDTEFSLVDLGDVAAAAVRVLTEPGHEGRVYDLCGPVALSSRHMAAALATVLGRPVEAVAADAPQWETKALSAGLPPYAIDSLLRMFRWYDRHPFVGSAADLEELLERPAGSFDEFVWREIGGRGKAGRE